MRSKVCREGGREGREGLLVGSEVVKRRCGRVAVNDVW